MKKLLFVLICVIGLSLSAKSAVADGLTFQMLDVETFAIGDAVEVQFQAKNMTESSIVQAMQPAIINLDDANKIIMLGAEVEVSIDPSVSGKIYSFETVFEPIAGVVFDPKGKYDATLIDPETGEELIISCEAMILQSCVKISVNDTKAATLYYSSYNLKMPEGVRAYVYGLNDSAIEQYSLREYFNTDIIPADTPVVFYADAEGECEFEIVHGDGTLISGINACLAGTDTAETFSNSNYIHYILGKGSKGLGWYMASSDGHSVNSKAHKAYLRLPTGGSSMSFIPASEDQAAGIAIIPIDDEKESAKPVYNIVGQEVGSCYKGILIKNGQKTYIK